MAARRQPKVIIRGPFEAGLLPHAVAWARKGGGDAGARARARAQSRRERQHAQQTAMARGYASSGGQRSTPVHVSYRQCKSALVPPVGWQPHTGVARSSRAPPIDFAPAPVRVWGYGFAHARGGHGLRWNAKAELVYFVGHVAVVLEPRTRRQRIFAGFHDGPITCLALDSTRRFAATGQRANKTSGVGGRGHAYVCVWDTLTKQCIAELGLR